jgi:hypothetical protein
MGQVMEAYTIVTLVDMFGDIPYIRSNKLKSNWMLELTYMQKQLNY